MPFLRKRIGITMGYSRCIHGKNGEQTLTVCQAFRQWGLNARPHIFVYGKSYTAGPLPVKNRELERKNPNFWTRQGGVSGNSLRSLSGTGDFATSLSGRGQGCSLRCVCRAEGR